MLSKYGMQSHESFYWLYLGVCGWGAFPSCLRGHRSTRVCGLRPFCCQRRPLIPFSRLETTCGRRCSTGTAMQPCQAEPRQPKTTATVKMSKEGRKEGRKGGRRELSSESSDAFGVEIIIPYLAPSQGLVPRPSLSVRERTDADRLARTGGRTS